MTKTSGNRHFENQKIPLFHESENVLSFHTDAREKRIGVCNQSIRFRNNYTTVTNSVSESGRRVNANYVRSGSPYR